MADGLWPMVYQGLGVYREPVQGPMALPLPLPSLGFHAGFGGHQAALHELPSLGQIPYTLRESDTGRCGCPALHLKVLRATKGQCR